MAKAHVNIDEGETFNVTQATTGIYVEMVWLIFRQLSQTNLNWLSYKWSGNVVILIVYRTKMNYRVLKIKL